MPNLLQRYINTTKNPNNSLTNYSPKVKLLSEFNSKDISPKKAPGYKYKKML